MLVVSQQLFSCVVVNSQSLVTHPHVVAGQEVTTGPIDKKRFFFRARLSADKKGMIPW
jgi:hypothetical protein